MYTTQYISLNYKVKPPWRISLCKETRLSSLEHLMQQKQLVVDFRLWWQIIAEMLEARGVKIYWEAHSLAFISEGNKKLCYTEALLASTLRQRKYLLQCVSQLIVAWWPRFERSHIFTFQWYKCAVQWKLHYNLLIVLWWEQREVSRGGGRDCCECPLKQCLRLADLDFTFMTFPTS